MPEGQHGGLRRSEGRTVRVPFRCTIASTLIVALPLALAACGTRDGDASVSVSQAWELGRVGTADQSSAGGQLSRVGTAHQQVKGQRSKAEGQTLRRQRSQVKSRRSEIATIAGRPVPRERLVDLLMRAHGPGLLEQLIVLDAATRMAAEQGLTISQADLNCEYDLALRRLVDPLFQVTTGPFDREEAERLLDSVLSKRNISREEFLMGLRRNAYLRRIVQSKQVFTEEQLRGEFERCYGSRVRIRHIQLATPGAVTRAWERLAAGEAFAALARSHSVNLASAVDGGLLEPFGETDDRVPAAMREAAFSLRVGAFSQAVRIGKWFHIIKLEEVLPAGQRDFSAVRGELERSLRERVSEPAMRELYERLFRRTPVEIHDVLLRDAFERKHQDRPH